MLLGTDMGTPPPHLHSTVQPQMSESRLRSFELKLCTQVCGHCAAVTVTLLRALKTTPVVTHDAQYGTNTHICIHLHLWSSTELYTHLQASALFPRVHPALSFCVNCFHISL
jgi:hypothetical protein